MNERSAYDKRAAKFFVRRANRARPSRRAEEEGAILVVFACDSFMS